MRNLAIGQQRDEERYTLVRASGWDRPKASFKPGDYVLVKQKSKHTLDVPARPHILRVVEVKDSGVAILQGSDAARIKEHLKNILDPYLYPERFYRGAPIHCRVSGRRSGPTYMVLCETCNEWYHLWCLGPQLERVLEDRCQCPKHSSKIQDSHVAIVRSCKIGSIDLL